MRKYLKMNGLELRNLRKKNGLKRADMADLLKISISTLDSWELGRRNITAKNKAWIIKMLSVHNSEKENQVKYVQSTNFHIMQVPIVNHYAYASYMDGFDDEEYIKDLPLYPIVRDREYKGEYRIFEVKGDSMEDGTDRSIKEYDKLLCRNIQQHHWTNKLHINQYLFVIVHRTDGIVVKQIKEHNTEKGTLLLHSFNSFYDDYEVHLNDVVKLFNVIEILGRKIKF